MVHPWRFLKSRQFSAFVIDINAEYRKRLQLSVSKGSREQLIEWARSQLGVADRNEKGVIGANARQYGGVRVTSGGIGAPIGITYMAD